MLLHAAIALWSDFKQTESSSVTLMQSTKNSFVVSNKSMKLRPRVGTFIS